MKCQNCQATMGNASIKCPRCGTLTARGRGEPGRHRGRQPAPHAAGPALGGSWASDDFVPQGPPPPQPSTSGGEFTVSAEEMFRVMSYMAQAQEVLRRRNDFLVQALAQNAPVTIAAHTAAWGEILPNFDSFDEVGGSLLYQQGSGVLPSPPPPLPDLDLDLDVDMEVAFQEAHIRSMQLLPGSIGIVLRYEAKGLPDNVVKFITRRCQGKGLWSEVDECELPPSRESSSVPSAAGVDASGIGKSAMASSGSASSSSPSSEMAGPALSLWWAPYSTKVSLREIKNVGDLRNVRVLEVCFLCVEAQPNDTGKREPASVHCPEHVEAVARVALHLASRNRRLSTLLGLPESLPPVAARQLLIYYRGIRDDPENPQFQSISWDDEDYNRSVAPYPLAEEFLSRHMFVGDNAFRKWRYRSQHQGIGSAGAATVDDAISELEEVLGPGRVTSRWSDNRLIIGLAVGAIAAFVLHRLLYPRR